MTKKQKENLKKLLNLKIPKGCKFTMGNYFYNNQVNEVTYNEEITKDSYECGTSACFAGYLPYVTGIAKKKSELWQEYIFRVTGLDNQRKNYLDFEYLFDIEWPNSLKQAKERLKKFIDNDFKAPYEFKGL